MQRRNFLIASSILASTSLLKANTTKFAKDFKSVKPLIEALSFHFFPPKSRVGFAKDLNIIGYLFDTINHQSFDKDIRAFVIDGAKELDKRSKGKFMTMNSLEKETFLRAFEKTSYGSRWLSRMLRLMIEGTFCDPIYGANTKEMAWKSIHTFGAYPRPKNRYMGL